jgi:ribosome-associated protein
MRSLADRFHEQAKADADDRELTSRTDRRREQSAREIELKSLAGRLVALKPQRLDRLALGEELVSAILTAQAIRSAPARNRQVSVVRQHLRDLGPEVEAVLTRLAALEQGAALVAPNTPAPAPEPALVAVTWSERLERDGDPALEELMQRYPDADRQLLRQRVRAVAKARRAPDLVGLERAQRLLRLDVARFVEPEPA